MGSILVALGLVAAFAVPAVNAAASNPGDVWVDNVGQPSGPGHEMDPHLACQDINLWGDALADPSGTYTIDGWSPSGAGDGDQAWPASPGNASWSYDTGTVGTQVIDVIDVSQLIDNAVANGDALVNKQGFHFKLQFSQDPQKNKTFWVDCGLPSIGTTPSAGGTVGTVINDTATVSGGNSPTGDVTFKLYAPGDLSCNSAPVFTDTKALGVASGYYTTAAVGIYRWTATYNGDTNNLAVTSGCQDELVTTTPVPQGAGTLGTQQGAGTLGASVTLPRAGAGPQHPGGSAAGGGGPSGAVGIMATLLLALVGGLLFTFRRRHGAEMGQPGA